MISTIPPVATFEPVYLSGGGLTVAEYKCKTHPNGARQHYWFFPYDAPEPKPDEKCQCGETTWAAEKAKQGIPV